MKKKILSLLIVIALALTLSLSLVACNDDSNTNKDKDKDKDSSGVIVATLADLYDYGEKAEDYNPAAVGYTSSAKTEQAAKLLAKQDSEKAKHNYKDNNNNKPGDVGYNADEGTNYDATTGKFNWEYEDDGEMVEATTFTKIFIYADVNEIIDRMSKAGVSESNMIECVEYITRKDSTTKNNLTIGQGSAIQDYNELDALYDLYDEDDSDENYLLLQKKRRKVLGEVFKIFEDAAGEAARAGIDELSYAQKVVQEIMMLDYAQKTGDASDDFVSFFKGELFDYDSLVYFNAFNQSCGVGASGDYYLMTGDYTVTGTNRKTMATLYGYYYQYEKADYSVFNDAEYYEYLDLGLKQKMTDAEALKYRDYDQRHYAGAYRYTDTFYKTYYTAHFGFQLKQENMDTIVYGITPVNSTGSKYSTEMLNGLNTGMGATLKMSDVNYEYSKVDANVTNYNQRNTAYYSFSEADRDNENESEHKMALVNMELEQLKSQYYTLTHKTLTASDFTNALIYQIYSFSGDYCRTIQSNKKDSVIYQEEINRLEEDLVAETDAGKKAIIQTKIDDKEEELGRNQAMLKNHEYFYGEKGDVANQIKTAGNHNWTKITEEVKYTMDQDYQAYHNDKKKSGVSDVDVKFEDTLIKKTIKNGDTAANEKEYDTSWNISRLLDSHENVFRYAYGQIAVEYREIDVTGYVPNVTSIDAVEVGDKTKEVNIDPYGAAFTSRVTAVSTTDRTKFTSYPTNFGLDYQTKNFGTDENISLAYFNGTKWTGVVPTTKQSTTSTKNVTYIEYTKDSTLYQYFFEGWYVDEELKYKAEFSGENTYKGEEFSYDIRLYPAYRVVKSTVSK